jgi:hypothetical protein
MLFRLAVLLVVMSPSWVTAQTLTTLVIPNAQEDSALGNPRNRDSSISYVRVFADGAVRSGVTGETENGTATGSLGVQVASELAGNRTDATFLVSVVGTGEVVSESYGRSILAPGSGSTLSAGLVDARIHDVFRRADLRGYLSVSTSDWSVPVDSMGLFSEGGDPRTYSVGVFGMGILVGETLVRGIVASNTSVAVTLDLGVSSRFLIGDLSSEANESFREGFIGTDRNWFVGVEGMLGVQINGIKAGISVYRYFDTDLSGFSDGQVVAGIGIQTPIVSGILNR